MRKEYILRFNVSMSISFLMHVMESIHHLVEVGPTNFFCKLSSLSNEIKEFSSSHIFQNDSETVICGLILFLVDSVFPHTQQFYQILMIQLFHNVELMFQSFQGGCLFFVFLDGHQISLGIFS